MRGESGRRSHDRVGGRRPLHGVSDVTFKKGLSRLRAGHGARNTAVVRRFALDLLSQVDDKTSLKTRRKLAEWSTDDLLMTLRCPAP